MSIKYRAGSAHTQDFSHRSCAGQGLSLVLAGTRGFSVTTLLTSQGAFSSTHKAAEGENVLYHLSPKHPQVTVRPPVLEPWVQLDPVSISAEGTRKSKGPGRATAAHIKLTSAWASQGLETQPGERGGGWATSCSCSITSFPGKNTWFLWTAFSAMGQYHDVIEIESRKQLGGHLVLYLPAS